MKDYTSVIMWGKSAGEWDFDGWKSQTLQKCAIKIKNSKKSPKKICMKN